MTGTDEFNEIENKIQIFPNPANKEISIISHNSISEVKIFTQTGFIVFEEMSPENTIDVSNLQPGLYFIGIKSDSGLYREKLIIK